MKRNAPSTKSHFGCQRCKERKIKCDEGKPACENCRRAGDICPGFTPKYKWIRKHETLSAPQRGAFISQNRGQSNTDKLAVGDPVPFYDTSHPDASDCDGRPAESSIGAEFAAAASWHDEAALDMDLAGLLDYGAILDHPSELNFLFPSLSQDSPTRWLGNGTALLPVTQAPNKDPARDSPDLQAVQEQSQQVIKSIHDDDDFLETFYRLSLPMAPKAQFTEQHLVQHYFAEVCPLVSCFDSALNPLRTLVGELWSSSSTIYHTIQSMAVANLSNHYAYMSPLVVEKRCKAWKSLQFDLQLYRNGNLSLERLFISLLLLGLSATWHDTSNLGLQYLLITRILMRAHIRTTRNAQSRRTLHHESFFRNAVLHWEMHASFVDPSPKMTFAGYGMPVPQHPSQQTPKLPHPWSGVSIELEFVLAEVGRILRGRQSTLRCAYHGRQHSSHDRCEYEEKWAGSLERYLCDVSIPDAADLLDYADANTPSSDLIRSAHAYRYVGLTEIYSAFPRLLELRICNAEKLPMAYDQAFEVPIEPSVYNNLQHSWLFAIASHGLEMLRPIFVSSGSCRLQPTAIISLAGQLRYPHSHSQDDSAAVQKAVGLRSFVETRMLALSRKYPEKPLLQMLDTVKETWQRLDDGAPDVHWQTLAEAKGWQTMMV